MEDVLAVALKAKVSRLDDASVDRAHRDFVNFLAFDSVEVGHPDEGRRAGLPAPRIVAWTIGSVETYWLQPGMAFRTRAELLGNLALEQMNLGTRWSERWEAVRIQGRSANSQ
jgi:hypothetical protein